MPDDVSKTTAEGLERFIQHLRRKDQSFVEVFGGYRREVKSDWCVAADFMEAMRSELPHWQVKEGHDAEY